VSSCAFAYLSYYTWQQVGGWLRRNRATWKDIRRRYCAAGWWAASEERQLFNPAKVTTTRYRTGNSHPVSLAKPGIRNHAQNRTARCLETGTSGAGSGPETGRSTRPEPRPGPTSPPTAARGRMVDHEERLGNHAARTLDQLEVIVRSRLRTIQRRPDLINALLGQTGLTLDPHHRPWAFDL
jgi:hypothetical protein